MKQHATFTQIRIEKEERIALINLIPIYT